jgi:hypothetical protein
VVVVLPSPAGVGLMAVTRISLPSRASGRGQGLRVHKGQGQLGLVVAVGDEVFFGNAQSLLRQFGDAAHAGQAGDLDVAGRQNVLLKVCRWNSAEHCVALVPFCMQAALPGSPECG